jgi:hypothetical protein
MALSFGSVISFSYICIVNEKDGLLRRESRLRCATNSALLDSNTPIPQVHTIVYTHKKKPLKGFLIIFHNL